MSRPPITRWDGVLFQRQLDAALDYIESLGGGGVSDGDKGDITISGSGSVWTVDAVALANVTGLSAALAAKQDTLVSATNIKTINGASVLGSGDLAVSGGLGGLATVTVPQKSLEWSETVTATGVTGSSRIVLGVASHDDSDENDAEMLDIMAMSATPGAGQITVEMSFATPTRGAIKLNWMAS